MEPTTLAGLGGLAALKASILPKPMADSDEWDVALLGVGRGVAGFFDAYLNRKLARAVDWTEKALGDAMLLSLERYPLEEVSKVELQVQGTAPAWQDYTTATLYTLNERAGLVSLAYTYGTDLDALRVTYTGGFWIDTSADLSGECPAGATPLPWELFNAWTIQCAEEAARRKICGLSLVLEEGKEPRPYNFTPAVLAVLDAGFRRM